MAFGLGVVGIQMWQRVARGIRKPRPWILENQSSGRAMRSLIDVPAPLSREIWTSGTGDHHYQSIMTTPTFKFHRFLGNGIQERKYGIEKGDEKKGGDVHVGGKSRPLSPHLPVYKPQLNSTLSIYNRVSGAVLTTVVAASYLLTTATDYLTLYPFYTLLFHSKHLVLITSEVTLLALAYHFLHEAPHVYHALADRLSILADRPTRLAIRGLVLSKEEAPKK